jgi:hypothetical protein
MDYLCIKTVPSSEELKNLVLKEIHDFSYARHHSYKITIATIRCQYYWPRMKKDVVDYISRYMECQRVKTKHRHPMGLLQPLSIPEKNWEVVTIDFVTKFLRTMRKHDSIMVVVDKLTKASHFVLAKMTHMTSNIAEICMKEIARLHGIPKAIVSNRNTNFTSKFWRGLFKVFGTNLNFSTAYHP